MVQKLLATLLLTTLLLTIFASQANAADQINTTYFGNVAIEGYDAVAYFTENSAVKGKSEFTHKWNQANWRFSSAANRDSFKESPEKYAPQYGGYCAYAVSQGGTAGIDPDQFTILDDKLYLNYSPKIQKKWLQDRDNYIVLADKNWPEVLK